MLKYQNSGSIIFMVLILICIIKTVYVLTLLCNLSFKSWILGLFESNDRNLWLWLWKSTKDIENDMPYCIKRRFFFYAVVFRIPKQWATG